MQAFASGLRRLREDAGLSLADLAQRANYAQGTMSKATDGRTWPTEPVVRAYVVACGGDPGDWLARREAGMKAASATSDISPAPDGADVPASPGAPARNPPRRWRRWLRPRWLRPRWLLPAVAVVVAVVVALALAARPGKSSPALLLPGCAGPATGRLEIAASQDLAYILAKAAGEYGLRSAAGQCMQVSVEDINSGTAMTALARGWTESDGTQPDVWSPASDAWLTIARARARGGAAARLPAQQSPLIVTTPLVIAMPEPMARVLGWPNKKLGWNDLESWARTPDFWARHGHPQWGQFQLGKTNPQYSTSGLNATIAAFFAATGTSDELTTRDLASPRNQAFERAIEDAAVHYGDTTLTFLANLRDADDAGGQDGAESYISAVTIEESAMLAYNAGYPCGSPDVTSACARTSPPHTKLVAFYPDDGNLFSDHPYIELNGMTAAKKAVAANFLTFLHTRQVQGQFAQYGFRTYQDKPTTLVTQDNGALPATPIAPLPLPPGAILDQLLTTWTSLRKPARVLLLIDTSGSMSDPVTGSGLTKIQLLQQAVHPLLDGFSNTDQVGLWKFSAPDALGGTLDYRPLVPVGPMSAALQGSTRRVVLAQNISALVPQGATGLYETIAAAVKTMRQGYDPDAINAVVLLTDGRNEISGGLTLPGLLHQLTDPSQPQVRIFTIAYGSQADQTDANGKTVLQQISSATRAREYDAKDPTTISSVLTAVISNF